MKVGLCLPISERGADRQLTPYREMRELALIAEQGGLDSIWVADHLFFESQSGPVRGAWESLSVLGALAEATERVELGPFVMCTPFRNPGLIAWLANTLDHVSDGRLVLGLGSGWHEPEFAAFGFEFDRRVSLFEESLEMLVPLLREGSVDFEGELLRGQAELRPPPTRAGGPPILIAASKPRMMSLTARWADRWNSVWYALPDDEFRAERAKLEAACREIGRDPAEIEVSAGIAVGEKAKSSKFDVVAGSVESIADALNAWRAEGVDEVMCRMEPPSLELAATIARAAKVL